MPSLNRKTLWQDTIWAGLALLASAVLVLIVYLWLDPWRLTFLATLSPEWQSYFREIQKLGRSEFYLIPLVLLWAGSRLVKRFADVNFGIIPTSDEFDSSEVAAHNVRRRPFGGKHARRLSAYRFTLVNRSIISRLSFALLAQLWVGFFVRLLKMLIGRARPLEKLEGSPLFKPLSGVFENAFHALPSGHSATAMTTALTVMLILPRSCLAWSWLMLVPAVSVGIGRVVVQAHYPADVLAGFLLALILVVWLRRRFTSF